MSAYSVDKIQFKHDMISKNEERPKPIHKDVMSRLLAEFSERGRDVIKCKPATKALMKNQRKI